MAIRTKGDLKGFTTRDESTYGTFDASEASLYGGVLSGWDDGMSADIVEDEPQQDGEAFSAVVIGTKTYGYTADMTIPRGQGILQAWLKKAIGADISSSSSSLTNGPMRDIPSFSTVFKKGDSEYLGYFGCKIDNFTIKADGRGKPIQFSATAFSRYMAISTNETFRNITTSVSFPILTRPTGSPITYCSPVLVNNADAQVKSWSLSINNNLQREEDAVISGSTCYPLSAGLDSVPTDREIILEVTRAVSSSAWDTYANSAWTTMRNVIVLDGLDIILSNCYIEPKLCKATQGTYDETLTIHARNIAYCSSS